MSQIKRHLEQLLDPADSASTELLQSLGSALALEAMCSYLMRCGKDLSPAALPLVRIAIEAHCVRPLSGEAQKAFAMEGIESPQEAVEKTIDEVKAQIHAAWDQVDSVLAKAMVSQVEKMSRYKCRAKALHLRLTDLTQRAHALATDTVPQLSFLPPTDELYRLCTKARGFVEGASDVPVELAKLLKAHEKAFKTTIVRLVDWLKDHEADLLANRDVFASLSYDGKDLLVLPELDESKEGSAYGHYRSIELPGGAQLSQSVYREPVTGHEAIEAMEETSLTLWVEREPWRPDLVQFNVLTVQEMQALTRELAQASAQLGEWYDSIYTQLWQDDKVSEILCKAVFRGLTQDNAGAREYKRFALTVFHLMHVATQDIDSYTFGVLEDLCAYVEASLAQYPQAPAASVPEGT